MTNILCNHAEPFEQIINSPLTECRMPNLVTISQAVSKDKLYKDYTVLHMYTVHRQGQTRAVKGSNYSPAAVLSEEKYP